MVVQGLQVEPDRGRVSFAVRDRGGDHVLRQWDRADHLGHGALQHVGLDLALEGEDTPVVDGHHIRPVLITCSPHTRPRQATYASASFDTAVTRYAADVPSPASPTAEARSQSWNSVPSHLSGGVK
ncbi:hypothetical protein GCM10010121_059100 [Streptomyces brasiliensis]|uniref:Uncharacterized protein n=1 Tax=Streptomyces brasiliensis TaxID=1954 RepID=A0A917NXZ7_9ACTN|nr:hypothetical protein GCM10010121_059100 [Streptomyces brasiliensis]